LVLILWLVKRIHSPLDVPKGTTYNTTFIFDVVILRLIENVPSRTRRKTLKGCLIHMDNARPHISRRAQRCIEASRAGRRPHPSYSLDLALSDFFLLGHIKGKLSDCNCESWEDLAKFSLESIKNCPCLRILGKRLKWAVQARGKYHAK
jgi:hypothetical protein